HDLLRARLRGARMASAVHRGGGAGRAMSGRPSTAARPRVPERSGQEFVTAFLEMLRERAFDRLPEFLSPDCVFEYPQSGERFRGLANIRPLFENYPGGLGRSDADSLRV